MRRTARSLRALGALTILLAACGGDDADSGGAAPEITVAVADDIPSIIRVGDVTCRREGDTELVAAGVVTSKAEDKQYVSLQVRFVDADGVRVELATDSVSDLQVGESARWDATTYADGAADVRRCEVTATVS
jgi:hypothetical protein